MPIPITGLFEPSGGPGAFDLYQPEDIQAGDIDVSLTLIASGKVLCSGIDGEIKVQTFAGTPVHSANEGTPCWDTTNNKLYVNNNGTTGWTEVGAGGASSDSFKTITTSSGTSPVADSATDTLTLTGTAPIVVTGDSATDTIVISTTSASVPAPTTIYDHLESSDGSTWSRVQSLRLNGTSRVNFNGTTETVYSSTSNQLDLTSGGLIKIHAATEIQHTINSNAALSTTTSEHRWYISGNDNLYLDASVGSGKLGYYTGAVTTAYATWSSVTWQLINANNSGVITIQALADSSSTIKLLPYDTVTIGSGVAGRDYILKFDGETNDGVLTWMEDEDYFLLSDDVLMNSTERIYFEDTNQYIYSPSAAVLSIVAADSSGVINITASGTSAEVNIQATSNLSVRIAGTDEYFVFERASSGADYASKLTFRGYDDDSGGMANVGYIHAVSSFTGITQEISTYIGSTKKFVVSNGPITMFPSSATSGIVFTDGANSTHDLMYTGNTVGLRIKSGGAMQIQAAGYASQINLIIPDGLSNERNFFFTVNSAGTTGTFCYSADTFVIGGSSASGRTLTLSNSGGGTFTCNIVSSSEWSFTSTSLTIGGGNNVVLNTGTGTQWGTGNTQKQAWWGATAVGQSTGWGCSNVTTDKGLDCNSTTLDEVADVLGSLIDQLKTYGLLGA